MTLNKEASARFADALDSGEYAQGYGILCDSQGYCVWGVATQIVHEELGFKKVSFWDYSKYVKVHEDGTKVEGSFIPPGEILEHYGLGYHGDERIFGTLLDMNDNRDYTFPQIAEYIRQEVLNKED